MELNKYVIIMATINVHRVMVESGDNAIVNHEKTAIFVRQSSRNINFRLDGSEEDQRGTQISGGIGWIIFLSKKTLHFHQRAHHA